MNNTDFGKFGEELAEKFLKEKGFTILARNFRCGKNEVDLITEKNNIVSFVEVKTRNTTGFGHPLEAVTVAKQRELAKAAACFIQKFSEKFPDRNVMYRFDALGILLNGGEAEYSFVEDAFRLF
jgi:putative endonuclease